MNENGDRAAHSGRTYDPMLAHPEWQTAASGTFWLIERGQPERQAPTVWWYLKPHGVEGWTTDAIDAFRFESRAAAEEIIEGKFTPMPSRGGPSARAVEHSWLPAASGDVEAARAALLHLLGDATSSTAVEDLEAAVRAESAQELAALREALLGADTALSELVADGWSSLSVRRAFRAQNEVRAALAATPAEDGEVRK